MLKIAYQGTLYSNSYYAALDYVEREHGLDEFELIPAENSLNVVSLLEKGIVEIGILAKSNSTMGTVQETFNALDKKSYDILDRFTMPINHCLFIKKGTEIEDIKYIQSHKQAIGQCKNKLKEIANHKIKYINSADTAKSARMIAYGEDRETAVICSEGAGKHYDLHLVQKGIQDQEDNRTKFIAIKNVASKKIPFKLKLLQLSSKFLPFINSYLSKKKLVGYWVYKVNPSSKEEETLLYDIQRVVKITYDKKDGLIFQGWNEGDKTKMFHSVFSSANEDSSNKIKTSYKYEVDSVFGDGINGYVNLESEEHQSELPCRLNGVYISLKTNSGRDARGTIHYKRISEKAFLRIRGNEWKKAKLDINYQS